MRIQFLKSPTGAFNYAYSEGDIADVNHTHAREMIAAGFAVKVEQPEMTESQIKAELLSRGVDFDSRATKEKLIELLNA